VLAAAVAALCAGQLLLGPVARAAACPAPITTVLDATPAAADRTVALTFDDGPRPDSTPAVLDVLRARGVTATFFVTGSNAARYPDLVRRIVAEGHAVGNHTWSHPDLSGLSPAGRVAEIERTTQAIVDATGTAPCFFRGPYGIHRSASIAGPAWERGMTVVGWTLDTRDWTTPAGWSPAFQRQIVDAATAPAGAHPIVLLHDGGGDRQNTVAALDPIISHYVARGHVFTDPAGRGPRQGTGAGGSEGAPVGDGGSAGGTHVVQSGDTLSSIAARYGVRWQDLHAANLAVIGPDPGLVRAGQRLTVPGAGGSGEESTNASSSEAAGTSSVVRPGDSLSSIAARYGVRWQDLHAANLAVIGPDPGLLRAGQELTIPGG
jgi:peptidoglycan/xylan/chitin deacetylase (PgdA/CDA1 family)/LysM repeat protein